MRLVAELLIFLVFWSCLAVSAQTGERGVGNKPTSSSKEKRLALVIGNGNYQFAGTLPNPTNDAQDMAETLRAVGFEVILGIDQNKRQMEGLIRQFGEKLSEDKGVGLFFYAGHGIQSGGENFLVPIDADIPVEDEITYSSVKLGFLLDKLVVAENRLNIVILDACRNNPFALRWRRIRDISTRTGLANIVEAPTGTLIAYATAPGKAASDGNARNGLYTQELLREIRIPDQTLEKLFQNVRKQVIIKSANKQVPWESTSLIGNFCFAGCNFEINSYNTQMTGSNSNTGDRVFWQEMEKRNTVEAFNLYLTEYPKGEFVPLAKLRISEKVNQSNGYFKLANDEIGNRNFKQAIVIYSGLIEIDPNNAWAYYGRGYCYYQREKPDQAIADLTKAIQLMPSVAIFYNLRGVAKYYDLKFKNAVTDFSIAINIEPKNAFFLANRGDAYREIKQYQNALVDYNVAIQLNPNVDWFYKHRSKVYRKIGRKDLETADRQKAKELEPKEK